MASNYIDQALMKKLLARTTLTARIDQRLYMDKASQGAATPYVVQSQVVPDNIPITFGEGESGEPLFQWLCVSDANKETPPEAFLIAWEILNELRHYQGTYDGVVIKYIGVRGPKSVSLVDEPKRVYYVAEAEVKYIEP